MRRRRGERMTRMITLLIKSTTSIKKLTSFRKETFFILQNMFHHSYVILTSFIIKIRPVMLNIESPTSAPVAWNLSSSHLYRYMYACNVRLRN